MNDALDTLDCSSSLVVFTKFPLLSGDDETVVVVGAFDSTSTFSASIDEDR